VEKLSPLRLPFWEIYRNIYEPSTGRCLFWCSASWNNNRQHHPTLLAVIECRAGKRAADWRNKLIGWWAFIPSECDTFHLSPATNWITSFGIVSAIHHNPRIVVGYYPGYTYPEGLRTLYKGLEATYADKFIVEPTSRQNIADTTASRSSRYVHDRDTGLMHLAVTQKMIQKETTEIHPRTTQHSHAWGETTGYWDISVTTIIGQGKRYKTNVSRDKEVSVMLKSRLLWSYWSGWPHQSI